MRKENRERETGQIQSRDKPRLFEVDIFFEEFEYFVSCLFYKTAHKDISIADKTTVVVKGKDKSTSS